LVSTLKLPKTFSVYEEPAARQFLDSVSRNSNSTKKTYATALVVFQKYLSEQYQGGKYGLTSILKPLQKDKIDVYFMLDGFVSFLIKFKNRNTGEPIALRSIDNYMTAVKSYLEYNDVDIAIRQFKRKVKMPTIHREDEEAVDAQDIRKIMLACHNRRLKPYLLVLASAGLRASEACAIRLCDIDYTCTPTKIHVRKEYAKTRVARDVYISDEATSALKAWLDWKYRERKYGTKWGLDDKVRTRHETDLVFTNYRHVAGPYAIYTKIRNEFVKILQEVGFEKRKEGMQRRTITLHSFRRYVKTVISDQVSKDYSEWFLGHSKSPYYTMKEPMRREIYATKCMKYLTFLDYTLLETKSADLEARNNQTESVISDLLARMKELESRIKTVEG
jgi:integrase